LIINIIRRTLCDEEKESSLETKIGQGEEADVWVSGPALPGPLTLWGTLLIAVFVALSEERKRKVDLGDHAAAPPLAGTPSTITQGVLPRTAYSVAPIHQPEILLQDRALILESWVLASLLSRVVTSSVRAGGSGGS
jgi:hypothetical protein